MPLRCGEGDLRGITDSLKGPLVAQHAPQFDEKTPQQNFTELPSLPGQVKSPQAACRKFQNVRFLSASLRFMTARLSTILGSGLAELVVMLAVRSSTVACLIPLEFFFCGD